MRRKCISVVIVVAAMLCALAPANAQSGSTIDLTGNWKFHVDPDNLGFQKGWHSPKYDDTQWQSLYVPATWEGQGVVQPNPNWKTDNPDMPYTGYAWYRREVTIPAAWKGKRVYLNLGRIDDKDWTYVNGVPIGEAYGDDPPAVTIYRSYDIPENLINFDQPNQIAVRVLDEHGAGGIIEGPVLLTVGGPHAYSQSGGQGRVGKDKVNVGASVTVEKDETVRDAISVMGNVTVKGHVTGDAVAVMGSVKVLPGGKVDGDAVAVRGKVERAERGQVGGETTTIGGPLSVLTRGGVPGACIPALTLNLIYIIALVALAAVIAALFPARMEMIAEASLGRPGLSFLYGLVLWLLAIPVGLFLLVTCIGIPLIAVEIALFVALAVVGKVGISLALGHKAGEAVHKPIASTLGAVVLGALLFGLVRVIPSVGPIAALVLATMGTGAVIITGFGADPEWWWNRKKRNGDA